MQKRIEAESKSKLGMDTERNAMNRTEYFREYMRKWRANEKNRNRENEQKRERRAKRKALLDQQEKPSGKPETA